MEEKQMSIGSSGRNIILPHTADAPLAVAFPPDITAYEFAAAEALCGGIEDISGVRPLRVCDGNLPDGAAGILIGRTGLPESDAAYAEIGSCGDVLCRLEGKRLAVASVTGYPFAAAVSRILSSMSYDTAAGTVVIGAGIDGSRDRIPGCLGSVPVPSGLKLSAYRQSHDGCDQLVFTGATPGLYAAYRAKLEENGFGVRYTADIRGNLFARYTKDGVSAYVYFTPHNSTLRLLAEPARNMHGIHGSRGTSAAVNVKPLMTVIGARFSETARYLNKDSGAGNMGYVFRLTDGRFIVVDGGMELGDYAEKILAAMKEQCGGGKPVVACWFLSHTHIDHTGAFLKIAAKYHDEVEIEEVACNFPSLSDAEASREAWNTRRVKEAVYHVFPNAGYSKLHTGELLRFPGAEVEVLYTQDDLVSQYFSILNDGYTWNTSSLCIRLHIGGNTVLLPADCDEVACGIMLSMYGDYLKSDILQVCHHGGWGGTTPFYTKVDPEVAIFSTSDALLPMYLQIRYNHDLVYGMHVREVHNNADRCRTFELPYHPSETRLPPDPAGEILYTKAKQLEALAAIDTIRAEKEKAGAEK